MPQEVKLSDPSGRGRVDGYKVIFPQMQHPYTEEEIEAVVHVMRNAEGQTQGKYLEKFEQDFAVRFSCMRRKIRDGTAPESGRVLFPGGRWRPHGQS